MTLRRGLSALVGVAVWAPRPALACAVCFGQSDSPMAWGVNMGIFLMLGVTGAVLAAFAAFFVYLMRRARIAAVGDAPVRAGRYAVSATAAQEGTAQC